MTEELVFKQHSPKDNAMRGPGVCKEGCSEPFICENNTEFAMFPENFAAQRELTEYFSTHLPNQDFEPSAVQCYMTHGYQCTLAISRICKTTQSNVCQFVALRAASAALLESAEKEVARDYFSADVTQQWLTHAKAIAAICARFKCSGAHREATVDVLSERDIHKFDIRDALLGRLQK